MQDINRILPFLLQRMREGRIAFFLGAGVPASEARLPSGEQLRRRLLQELGEKKTSKVSLSTAAQRFEDLRDRIELFEFLRREVKFQGNVGDAEVCPTYKMLFEFPTTTFLTTNFDELVETCAQHKGVNLRVYKMDKQLANFRLEERKLLKIHGDFSVPANEIVVTSGDYESYSGRCPLFCHSIADIFLKHTVVFLGYSLSDPNFLHIYGEVLRKIGSDLKMRSFAIIASSTSSDVQQHWRKRGVQVVVGSARSFVGQLLDAYKRDQSTFQTSRSVIKIRKGESLRRPIFGGDTSARRIRQSFAYYISSRKAQLKELSFASCTVDTVQTSIEILNPKRKLARAARTKAGEFVDLLSAKGFFPRLLPFLDEVSLDKRRRIIEAADFCIVLISSAAYEGKLNTLYGGIARKKPVIVFLHQNMRGRLEEDLVFAGLLYYGATVDLFKTRDLTQCSLRARMAEIIETQTDYWLVRAMGL